MASPLVFVRDARTLPFVPVTLEALEAIRAAATARRLAYARSLYLALLELANEGRGDRAAVSRKELGVRAGCSREMVTDLRPVLEAAGVVVVNERTHGGQQLEHEWVIVEPSLDREESPPPLPTRPDPPAHEADLSLENGEGGKGNARTRREEARRQLPDDFPDELKPHARAVYVILRRVAADQGAKEVHPLSLGRVMMARPRRPLVKVAHDLERWTIDSAQPTRDVVARYARFLDNVSDLAATERLSPEGVPVSGAAGRGGAAKSDGLDWRTAERLRVVHGGA